MIAVERSVLGGHLSLDLLKSPETSVRRFMVAGLMLTCDLPVLVVARN